MQSLIYMFSYLENGFGCSRFSLTHVLCLPIMFFYCVVCFVFSVTVVANCLSVPAVAWGLGSVFLRPSLIVDAHVSKV